MDQEQLRHLIANGETSTVELKVAPPRPSELAERLCGFANAQGGKLILGVEDSTLRLQGVKDVNAAIDIIMRAGRLCQPPVVLIPSEPQVFVLDGKTIVVATVQPSNGPIYQAGGVFWVRRGTYTVPHSIEEISEMLYNRGALRWELRPAEGATLDDLEAARIEDFLTRRAVALEGITSKRFRNQAEALIGLKCAVKVGDNYVPTNAGLLFFGNHPQEFLLQSGVVCVLYHDEHGLARYADRRVIRGALVELVKGVEAFFRQYVPVGARMEGFQRVDVPDYPAGALREAVLNAIIHRDYSREGEAIRIFYYKDRIQVHSPGLLMPGVTLKLLERGEAPSRLRNPVIAGLLRDVPGYVETIGSGIRLMIGEMHELNLPPPEFKEVSEFIVTFRRIERQSALLQNIGERQNALLQDNGEQQKALLQDATKQQSVLQEDSQQITIANHSKQPVSIDPFIFADQKARMEAAMRFVQERGSITNSEYRALTGLSESTSLRDLELLVQKGALKAVGQKRARRYLLP